MDGPRVVSLGWSIGCARSSHGRSASQPWAVNEQAMCNQRAGRGRPAGRSRTVGEPSIAGHQAANGAFSGRPWVVDCQLTGGR